MKVKRSERRRRSRNKNKNKINIGDRALNHSSNRFSVLSDMVHFYDSQLLGVIVTLFDLNVISVAFMDMTGAGSKVCSLTNRSEQRCLLRHHS